jgi:hypothetical protein
LEKNKTKNKFDKKRRTFEYLGIFLNYVSGYVEVNLLNKSFIPEQTIVAPIYFTQFCAHNIAYIPDNVFNVLKYKKPKLMNVMNENDDENRIIE